MIWSLWQESSNVSFHVLSSPTRSFHQRAIGVRIVAITHLLEMSMPMYSPSVSTSHSWMYRTTCFRASLSFWS